MLIYIANISGFIATIFYLYSDIQEDDLLLDKFYTIGNVFFLGHLFLLGSYIPCITVFLAVVRNVINRRFPDSDIVKYTFLGIFSFILVASFFYTDKWQNSLPAIVSLIMTFAFLYTKKNIMTLLFLTCSVLWILVALSIDSMPIVVLEVVSMILLLYRAYKQNRGSLKKATI